MTRHYMRDPIETHRLGYGYESVPAINVKHYGRWPLESDREMIAEIARLTGDSEDSVSQMIWENAQESFWEAAQELAREAGYARLYSEGRSGGWMYAMPHIEVTRDSAGDATIADFGERSRWLAFQRKINAMIAHVDANLTQETEFRLELAREDALAGILTVGVA